MVPLSLDHYDWLFSEAAAPYLARASASEASLVSLTQSLRVEIGRDRARLAIEQAQLRRRARQKFSHAECMFFAARLLEQATEERIARYKACRLPGDVCVADLCCGLGGDLLAIARRGPAVAVDRDPLATRLAAANCRALGIGGVRFETADVAEYDPAACGLWHIDPDRRPGGRRTTQLEFCEPAVDVLHRLVDSRRSGAIKLAPATVAPRVWRESGELEWIGVRRECRQQVAWLGTLARQHGLHTATVITGQDEITSVSGVPNMDLPPVPSVDRCVYEPHAAVLAAGLAAALAEKLGLSPIARQLAYLTGPSIAATPLLSGFEVIDVLPLERKRLRSVLRSRRIGRLEVKVRGIRMDPEAWRRQLRVPGDQRATLLIAHTHTRTLAILAHRLGE